MALEQRTEVEKDPHKAKWGARVVEQGRFQRNIYLRVIDMWQRRRREAASWPQYRREEEGVGGPPSPAVLGRERQGRLIGTHPAVGKSRRRGRPRERCTFSPSPVERIRLDL